jgi:hypothetical protein
VVVLLVIGLLVSLRVVASATRQKDGRARPERTPPRREAGKFSPDRSFAADLAAFMADAQVPWRVGALGGAVTDPAWRAKPSWYPVATEDRMIPPPAQPTPSWDYQHKRQAIARPGKSGAGRRCTQFGITRRP